MIETIPFEIRLILFIVTITLLTSIIYRRQKQVEILATISIVSQLRLYREDTHIWVQYQATDGRWFDQGIGGDRRHLRDLLTNYLLMGGNLVGRYPLKYFVDEFIEVKDTCADYERSFSIKDGVACISLKEMV